MFGHPPDSGNKLKPEINKDPDSSYMPLWGGDLSSVTLGSSFGDISEKSRQLLFDPGDPLCMRA